jgi:hypothetical protein
VAEDLARKGARFCRYCGARIPGDSCFCEACGSNLAVNSTTDNETDESANKCIHGYSLEEHCPTCVEHQRKMKLDAFNAAYAAYLSDQCPACSVAAGFILQDVIDKGLLSRKVWRKTTCRKCNSSFMLLGNTLYSIPICEKCGREMRLVDDENPQRITWKCFKHHSIGYGRYLG